MRGFGIPSGKSHGKRGTALCAGFVLVAIGAAAGLSAQMVEGGDAVLVSSAEAGALPPPSQWRCDQVRPEYSEWLAAGNTAQDWRYAGATYRDAANGEVYDWGDWLRWAQSADCAPYGAQESRGWMTGGRAAVGAAIGGLGAALLVMSNGANAKSPG